MDNISFVGIMNVATFKLNSTDNFKRGTDEGIPVKVSGLGTVSKCADDEGFDGILETIDRDKVCGAVSLRGFKTISYSGTAPTAGNVILVADGAGKVKTATTGQKYLVVDVDATAKTVTILIR
ncbi:MAG: hypothetical protein FWH53_00145 [Leptospirales bacterium]|nr:hypothetical protein [Leptospirales bacterium]